MDRLNSQPTKTLEEIAREQRREAARDAETVELFGILVKHPGFKRFQEVIDRMLKARGEFLLEPIPSLDAIPASEHQKGTMYGLALARDLPSVTIEVARQIREAQGEDDE